MQIHYLRQGIASNCVLPLKVTKLPQKTEGVCVTEQPEITSISENASQPITSTSLLDKKLQRFPSRVKYNPGTKIRLVEALAPLQIHRSISSDDFNLDWLLLVMRNKDAVFQPTPPRP